MKFTRKLVALLLALSCMLSLTACGGGEPAAEQPKADPNALFQALLTKVTYDTELSDLGEAGALYLPDLPADAKVQMYAGSGYYADKVAMITLADASDAEAFSESTEMYRKCLADIDRALAQVCDTVVEVSAGQYIVHKGELQL